MSTAAKFTLRMLLYDVLTFQYACNWKYWLMMVKLLRLLGALSQECHLLIRSPSTHNSHCTCC